MPDEFDAFNEQIKSELETDEKTRTQTETENTPPETWVRDVTVIGENDDCLKISAETAEGTVETEVSLAEAEHAMSHLGISDARDLEGQPVFIRKDDSGVSYLEFESKL